MIFDVEARAIAKNIEEILGGVGIFFRIFYRGKSSDSLQKKIDKNPGKYGESKKIQDLIGIRVCLYFSDDIDLVKDLISKKFEYDHSSSTIDLPGETEFGPTRYNLIFKLPDALKQAMEVPASIRPVVDLTFEVQIRTVLSEGWHEVEHDLRYKYPNDWNDGDLASRAFNGVFAALETSEWTMLKILDDQAHSHYKNRDWKAMLRSKFRLRFSDQTIDQKLISWLDSSPNDAKNIFRASREDVISYIVELGRMPVTMNNILYLYNWRVIKNTSILDITPSYLLRLFEIRNGIA